MNKSDLTVEGLRVFGLTRPEASIYLELLKNPATHAQLSLATEINRTTLYRLVDRLVKRGLVIRRVDDRGKFLVAADPSTFEIDVVTQEAHVRRQRGILSQLIPALQDVRRERDSELAVHAYEGTEGFKRLLWHELETQGDCLCMGFSTVGHLVLDHRWAEKHRAMTVRAGYRTREIANPGAVADDFTQNEQFLAVWELRYISRDVLPINHLMTVYNDTVAAYHVYRDRRVALKIVSKPYAETLRSIIEHYWAMAEPAPSTSGAPEKAEVR